MLNAAAALHPVSVAPVATAFLCVVVRQEPMGHNGSTTVDADAPFEMRITLRVNLPQRLRPVTVAFDLADTR